MLMAGMKSSSLVIRELFPLAVLMHSPLGLTVMLRYGSGIAANILRDPETARYVKSALLMDPISFMLHLPHVAYNFVSLDLSLD